MPLLLLCLLRYIIVRYRDEKNKSSPSKLTVFSSWEHQVWIIDSDLFQTFALNSGCLTLTTLILMWFGMHGTLVFRRDFSTKKTLLLLQLIENDFITPPRWSNLIQFLLLLTNNNSMVFYLIYFFGCILWFSILTYT